MPIFGIGLHIIVAIFFAIHALRNHRNIYWLIILFSFPLLGSVVYFVIEFLPASRVNRGLSKATQVATNLLDPERELRESRKAFDLSPSAQNRFRLANALLARGETKEAILNFDACLKGPFGKDPAFLFAAATAKLQDGQVQAALAMAKALRADAPDFLLERSMLLLAQAHWAADDQEAAHAEYSAAAERFGSIEAKSRYAIWAASTNDVAKAKKIYEELTHSQRHWNSHARSLNRPLLQQVEKAIAEGGAG